jgi:hypothetical protein
MPRRPSTQSAHEVQPRASAHEIQPRASAHELQVRAPAHEIGGDSGLPTEGYFVVYRGVPNFLTYRGDHVVYRRIP